MSRIAYVNGRYLPHAEASVHVEDRGYQFSDGVYEVIAVEQGRLVDEGLHMQRLERSLRELRIDFGMSRAALAVAIREVIRRNGVVNGIVYVQVTRGIAPRDHAFPRRARPSVVITARRQRPLDPAVLERGVKVIALPDIRWARRDIKSVSLLPNVLGKQAAREAGAFEAWMIDDKGYVTEGTSTNAWIVTAEGALVTRPADHSILNGVTRLGIIDIAKREGLGVVERPFTLEEAKKAREAFLSSTTSYVLPVTRIDDTAIGGGRPGPLSRKLRSLYAAHAEGAAA